MQGRDSLEIAQALGAGTRRAIQGENVKKKLSEANLPTKYRAIHQRSLFISRPLAGIIEIHTRTPCIYYYSWLFT